MINKNISIIAVLASTMILCGCAEWSNDWIRNSLYDQKFIPSSYTTKDGKRHEQGIKDPYERQRAIDRNRSAEKQRDAEHIREKLKQEELNKNKKY